MALSKIDSDGIVSGGITADSLNIGQIGGRRNIVYNGAMNIWQRGTSADSASNADYMCDRWLVSHSGLDGNVDWDQETSSTPDGFGYALKISTDASETSLDAADTLFIRQKFEGQDLQQLQKGTAGAKSLTLSFWVKSSVASTYTVELFDNDNTRIISKSYVINTADTWEFKTVVFEGDTTGALGNDNGDSLRLDFWIDAGSDYTSGTFSTAWQANDNTERVYDTTGWLESTTPTFYITGVQLEVGSVATPFEHRSYGEELAACQRYFWYKGYLNGVPQRFANQVFSNYNSTDAYTSIKFPVQMRSTPSGTASAIGGFAYYSANGSRTISSFNFQNGDQSAMQIRLNGSGFVEGYAGHLDAGSNGYMTFDAEL